MHYTQLQIQNLDKTLKSVPSFKVAVLDTKCSKPIGDGSWHNQLLNTAILCCRHSKFLHSSEIWRCSLKRKKKVKASKSWATHGFSLRCQTSSDQHTRKSAIYSCPIPLFFLGWTCMAVLMFLWEKDHFSTAKSEMWGSSVSRAKIKKSFDIL